MTERVVAAIENPLVDCIGHLTGRLILRREPYDIDVEQVAEAAARTGTMIEINGNPNRRDLNEHHARLAAEAGVTIVAQHRRPPHPHARQHALRDRDGAARLADEGRAREHPPLGRVQEAPPVGGPPVGGGGLPLTFGRLGDSARGLAGRSWPHEQDTDSPAPHLLQHDRRPRPLHRPRRCELRGDQGQRQADQEADDRRQPPQADTIDGSRINESKLGEVPLAQRAGSAGSADTAGTADHATTATTADTAGSANSANSAATAENANALGGQSAAQLRVSAATSSGGTCDPEGFNSPACATQAMNLPATSDVVAIARGSWYGTGAGPDKGECFISIDPNTNSPSSIRAEVGQVDAEHTDFDTAGDVSVNTTINDVPAGNQTFRMRCFQEDGDFHVEDAVITVMRLPS